MINLSHLFLRSLIIIKKILINSNIKNINLNFYFFKFKLIHLILHQIFNYYNFKS